MTNDELIALVEAEEANCLSSASGALSEQRREALQYYYGQPYGNEIEGRSQVVTTEVKDAIEGVMPTLLSVFASTDEIVRFDPEQNPQDEAAAQQATDYANYVFWRDNNGFLVLYCLIKDALLQKNGHVKVYWENYSDVARETYEGLTEMEFAMLAQDGELEVIEQNAYPDPIASQAMQAQAAQMQQMMPQMPMSAASMLYDVTFRRTKKYGKICIDPCPPEEVLIARDTPNELKKSRFVEHRTKKTISAIRQMGYNIDANIADNTQDAEFNQERVQRHSQDDSQAWDTTGGATNDKTTREVWFREAYLHVDFDGDGIAEYRKVTLIGSTLLDNVEFDSLPIIGGTAIPMPHKYHGLSFHDLAKDIQLVKSMVTRQLLDNAYVANNGRMAVLDGMVNMEDLLTSRPNGIVRMRAHGAVTRIDQPLLGAPFYNLLDYFDKVKQNRVGATDFPNAVEPDAINAKATFVEIYRNAALERINLMARILAEGPVKEIFWKIIELSAKHQDKARMVKLRGQWVNVDPREWKNKFNMTVSVGLGTGSQQVTLNGAQMIFGMQAEMLKMGLGDRVVTPQNMYMAARRAARAVFPKDADSFFTDPATMPPPQPQPDPDMLKLQLAWEKAKMGDAQRRDKAAQEFVLELKRQGVDLIGMALQAHQHDKEMRHGAAIEGATMRHDHIEGMMDRAASLVHKRRSTDRERPLQ